MLQPNERLPDVPRRPAPWNLTGSGWIVVLRQPAARQGHVRGPLSLLMYVDYAESGCGPYRELLFIPGKLPFEDGRHHYTISRILVSTWDSVVNGRENWGIPKDRADFAVVAAGGTRRGVDIRVTADDGHEVCSLAFARRALAPRLPVPGVLVPERMRTLAQRYGGRTFYYAPSTRGWVRPGRLVDWSFNADLFPDLGRSSVVAALEVERFRMIFPVSRVVARD